MTQASFFIQIKTKKILNNHAVEQQRKNWEKIVVMRAKMSEQSA